jgi:hypothetical protein
MKLKFYIKDGKKSYTMKEGVDNKKTEDAHYKFIKIKSSAERED